MNQYNPSNNQPSESVSTEERILLAAEEEFLAKGFAGARTTAIAEAAGVTHAMLHYYYRSKEKLFSKVISAKLDAIADTFIVNIDEEMPLADSIRKAVEFHFDLVATNPSLPRFMIAEVFPNSKLRNLLKEKIEMIATNTIGRLQEKIDKAATKGECRRISARSLLMDIISLNIFPIVAQPMWQSFNPAILDSEDRDFLTLRKEENVQTILAKLRAQI